MESFVTWKCQIYFLRPPYNMMPDKTFHFLLPIVISLKRNCAHLNARNKACFLLKSKIMKRAEKSEVRDETNLSQPQDFVCPTRFHNSSQLVSTCHITASHLAGDAFPFHQSESLVQTQCSRVCDMQIHKYRLSQYNLSHSVSSSKSYWSCFSSELEEKPPTHHCLC